MCILIFSLPKISLVIGRFRIDKETLDEFEHLVGYPMEERGRVPSSGALDSPQLHVPTWTESRTDRTNRDVSLRKRTCNRERRDRVPEYPGDFVYAYTMPIVGLRKLERGVTRFLSHSIEVRRAAWR